MSTVPSLGRLTKVDLRSAWTSEPHAFTPWLAEPDNLHLLGETLGIDLEVQATEERVGPFRADVLCREVGTDRLVLIENQIERTDHLHLGQLLTYAAGLDTAVICWIARRFVDEHRAVLDWLNEITDDRFVFFGIEIELWRIGDSPPAPRFNIVAKPNAWSRAVAKGAERVKAGESVGIDINRVAYWQAFEAALEEREGPLKPRGRPPRQGFYSFTLAPNAYLYASRDAASRTIAVFLGLYGADSQGRFSKLVISRTEIEKAVGEALSWREIIPGNKYWIVLNITQADPLDASDWARQHAWLIGHLERFRAVFLPALERIDTEAAPV